MIERRSLDGRAALPAGRARERGFNLLELLVVLALVGLVAAIVIPFSTKMILRTKMTGTAESVRQTLARARSEAVRRGTPVTVEVDLAEHALVTRTAIGELAYFQLPRASDPAGTIYFWGAQDNAPGGADALDGFTTNEIVFATDGSVEEMGSLRIGMGPHPRSGGPTDDYERNFLEVAFTIASTARTEVRKWIPHASPDGAYEVKTSSGSGTNWEWY